MPTAVKFSKKQVSAIMERYAHERFRPHSLEDLPVKIRLDVSQHGNSVCCHMRSTEGLLLTVDELIEWFDKLPDAERSEILAI